MGPYFEGGLVMVLGWPHRDSELSTLEIRSIKDHYTEAHGTW